MIVPSNLSQITINGQKFDNVAGQLQPQYEQCKHGITLRTCATCSGPARTRKHKVKSAPAKKTRKHAAPPAWHEDARSEVKPEPPDLSISDECDAGKHSECNKEKCLCPCHFFGPQPAPDDYRIFKGSPSAFFQSCADKLAEHDREARQAPGETEMHRHYIACLYDTVGDAQDDFNAMLSNYRAEYRERFMDCCEFLGLV